MALYAERVTVWRCRCDACGAVTYRESWLVPRDCGHCLTRGAAASALRLACHLEDDPDEE